MKLVSGSCFQDDKEKKEPCHAKKRHSHKQPICCTVCNVYPRTRLLRSSSFKTVEAATIRHFQRECLQLLCASQGICEATLMPELCHS